MLTSHPLLRKLQIERVVVSLQPNGAPVLRPGDDSELTGSDGKTALPAASAEVNLRVQFMSLP
jgi:hypothetical protein